MIPDDLPPDLIGLSEAAKFIRVSRQTVRRWVLQGRLPALRAGRHWKVSKADLLALVQRFGPGEANDRKIEQRTLPLSKKELAERELEIDQRLRESGIRR